MINQSNNIKIEKINSPINAIVNLPGSKSITNRALLLAALAQGESKLNNFLYCEDTVAFMQALESLGIKISYHQGKSECLIQGCSGIFPNFKTKVWCQDSGLAARFLLAACANQENGEYLFDGTERLRERPLGDLISVLEQQGANFSSLSMPLNISGKKLIGKHIFVPGDVSSQFLSALLIIAPYMQNSVSIETESLISQPYINLTCQMMKSFGVNVQVDNKNTQWKVISEQKYLGTDYVIEPDLSGASYFFAAAAVTGGSITVKNLDRENCLQGDIRFLDVLEKMGCVIYQEGSHIKIQGPEKLGGIDQVDMGDISDTMMSLAAIAPFASSPTLITNIANTRLKESDRIHAMVTNLNNLNIKTEQGDDWLKIYPGEPNPGVINSFNDHRIAMSCALLGLKASGIEINNPGCVAKTFPDFFERFTLLYA